MAICIVSMLGFQDHRIAHALGLVPRERTGTLGILFMGFVHASPLHLFANLSLFVPLSVIVLVRGGGHFTVAVGLITVLTGSLAWLIARPSVHIGASGIVFGLLGFLLARGLIERRITSILVSLAVAFLYGHTLWGLLPQGFNISFESHIAGFLAGIFTAWLIHRRRPHQRDRHDPSTATPDRAQPPASG